MRSHDRKDWRTSLYLSELSEAFSPLKTWRIEPPGTISDNSHEDARLFTRNGELWMSWTVSQWPTTQFRCSICFGKLVQDGNSCAITDYFFPKYGKNDFTALEKNWVPWEHRGETWCYYLTHDHEQTFIKIGGTLVTEVQKSKSLSWQHGPIHGGAITVLPNGNLAHFFNSRTGSLSISSHRYFCGVAELSPEPPFEMLRISRRPILCGEEGYNLERCRFFKPKVHFTCGAVRENESILLATGWNDCRGQIFKLKIEDLEL